MFIISEKNFKWDELYALILSRAKNQHLNHIFYSNTETKIINFTDICKTYILQALIRTKDFMLYFLSGKRIFFLHILLENQF